MKVGSEMQSVLLTISLQVSGRRWGKGLYIPNSCCQTALAVLSVSSLEGFRQSPPGFPWGHPDLGSSGQWMAGRPRSLPLAATVGLRNGREMQLGTSGPVLGDRLGALKQLLKGLLYT